MLPTVLIVEDYPLHAKLFSEIVRASGYAPVTATTGREGLSVARSLKPEAILLDILLPDIDGRAVLADLRRDPDAATIPVLAISAAPDREMEETCLDAGASCFRSKPVRLEVLIEDLTMLIEEARKAQG